MVDIDICKPCITSYIPRRHTVEIEALVYDLQQDVDTDSTQTQSHVMHSNQASYQTASERDFVVL